MGRGRRIRIGAAVAAACAAAAVSPAGAGPAGGLSFRDPVALESFAPLRTVVSAAYSARGGELPSDHEGSGEPVLEVDRSGTIYIAGTCCIGPAVPVWRSTDDGRTFDEVETPAHLREWTIGAEGDLAVDDSGNLFLVDTFFAGMSFTHWSARGARWEATGPTVGVTPGVNDRPWLAWSRDALYLYVNHGTSVEVWRSTNDGASWSSSGPLTWKGSSAGQPFFQGHMTADRATGAVWVVGLVGEEKRRLAGAVSTDGGRTFAKSVIATAPKRGGFSPVFPGPTAIDDRGNGYTTWSQYDRDGCDVFVSGSSDLGRSWSPPLRVNGGGGCATFPWVAARGDGVIAVAWYETPATETGDCAARSPCAFQDRVRPRARWYLHAALITGAGGAQPSIQRTRVETPTPVVGGPMLRKPWDFLEVEFGPDGRIHIAYAVKFEDSAPRTWYVSGR